MDLLFFLRKRIIYCSYAFAISRSSGFFIPKVGVCFQRGKVSDVRAIGEEDGNECGGRGKVSEWDRKDGELIGMTSRTRQFVLRPRLRTSLLPCPAMARAPPPSKATGRKCTCGCKTTSVTTMNRHMRQHAQRLNIKTTHLASLTAVFHPRPPAANRSHLPAMDMNQDDDLTGSGGQVGGLGGVPGVSTSWLNDSEADDSDSDEVSEGMMVDFDSDEFEGDEDAGCCETGEGRGPLEFELRAAKAGNVHS